MALIGISNTKLNASKKTSSGRRQMDLLAAHGSDAQALNNYYDSHADVIWRRFTAAEGVRKFVIEGKSSSNTAKAESESSLRHSEKLLELVAWPQTVFHDFCFFSNRGGYADYRNDGRATIR